MKVDTSGDRFAFDLRTLAGSEEDRAREAFGRLSEWSRQAARAMVVRRHATDDEADDVVQAAYVELWRRRTAIRAQTRGEWFALVRRECLWVWSKRLKGRHPLSFEEIDNDLPDADVPYIDALLATEDWHALRNGADRLWLGETDEGIDSKKAAAAVHLVLLGGIAPDSVAAMFNAKVEEIDGWLHHPAFLARALFAALCWPPDEIASFILRPDRPFTPSELDQISTRNPSAPIPEGWSKDEAWIACLRVRNGLRAEEIVRISSPKLELSAVHAALIKVKASLPYERIAKRLRDTLKPRGLAERMGRPELWKRIVFDYDLREISHRQIVELASPPARVASYAINTAKLNNWLSMGRLHAQLAAYLLEVLP